MSGMTDRELASKIGVRYAAHESCKIGAPFYAFTETELEVFAARLRGDGEQGQAVACLPGLPKPFTVIYDDVDHCEVPCYSPAQMLAYAGAALSTQPAPSAPVTVADAESFLAAYYSKEWRAKDADAIDEIARSCNFAHPDTRAAFDHITARMRRLSAPSEQVAPPIPSAPEWPGDGWLEMETAPRDGTLIRLLVDFTENATEDSDRAPTIGSNSFDNTGLDEWDFAGWSWEQDCYTQGEGTPVGWLPMLIESEQVAASVAMPESAHWAVGRFRSSHTPHQIVLHLSVGAAIERDAKHHSFVEWVYAHHSSMPVWRPISEAPIGKLCVVGWEYSEDPDEPDRHDFDYIEDGRWVRHDDNVDFADAVAPAGSRMPQRDPPYQWFIELPEMPVAAPAAPERDV